MQAGGYRLTDRAQTEARTCGLTQVQIQRVMSNTVGQEPISADLWKITDGVNTVVASPLYSVITSVARGFQKVRR